MAKKKTHPERAVLKGSGVSMLLQKYKIFLNNTNLRLDISHKHLHTINFKHTHREAVVFR